MRYICLGYMDETLWEKMTDAEQKTFMDECFAYDDSLRGSGYFVGGEGLQSSQNAATLRWKSERVAITDGPFTETKEQIGGIMILEARDLNHAIQLMSKHPSLRLGKGGGGWEILPAEAMAPMVDESERRRSKA